MENTQTVEVFDTLINTIVDRAVVKVLQELDLKEVNVNTVKGKYMTMSDFIAEHPQHPKAVTVSVWRKTGRIPADVVFKRDGVKGMFFYRDKFEAWVDAELGEGKIRKAQ